MMAATSAPLSEMAVTMDPRPSMLEVATAGEDHGDPVLVGRRDHLGVVHRPARLDDDRDAGGGHGVEAVAEREEGVGRGGAAGGPSVRFLGGDLGAVHP